MGRRTFLVEEVPHRAIVSDLKKLKKPAALPVKKTALLKGSPENSLPPTRWAKVHNTNAVVVASATSTRKEAGFILDYNEIDSGQPDFTFQSDTTYLLSGGSVYMDGTTTIEGGAVIKLNSSSDYLERGGSINCKTAPYRPAVFTSGADDTVGEILGDGSGTPGFDSTNA